MILELSYEEKWNIIGFIVISEETNWGQFIDKDGILVQVSGTQFYDEKII
ncbi:hypothetical protein [Clostridium botulinum]